MKFQDNRGLDMEDERVLARVRSQGFHGRHSARVYANILRRRALAALAEMRFEEAIRLAEREFLFCCRALGLTHQFSKAAQAQLQTLKGLRQTGHLEPGAPGPALCPIR